MVAGLEKRKNSLPRALLISWELTPGGAAFLALRHCRALMHHYEVDILVTGPYDKAFLLKFPQEVRWFKWNQFHHHNRSPLEESFQSFSARLQKQEPFQISYDLVLGTSILPNCPASAAFGMARARQKFLFLVDEMMRGWGGFRREDRNILSWAISEADLILPVSSRLWHKISQACPAFVNHRWQQLFPPLDQEEISHQLLQKQEVIFKGSIPNIITVARITPGKQLDLSIRVHHRLKSKGIRFKWYIIGQNDEPAAKAILQEMIRELGLESDFILLGYQPNLYACIREADLFVLLSNSEGCPTVILEALTLGIPVLSTDVSGADEMIEQETTGLIVANDIDAIENGLTRLIQDDSLRNRFRANLADRVHQPQNQPENGLLGIIQSPRYQFLPRVTILIPTYNQAQFIDKAIGSALAQDFEALEVIVLDDASTDTTESVVAGWKQHPRLRYIRNPVNIGRVANYHQGVHELARGEWVLLLDGDDYLTDSQFIRHAMEGISRNADRNIVFAQGGHRSHFLDGNHPDVDILPPIQQQEVVVTGSEYLILLFSTGFFTHLGSLYNRRQAEKVGFYTANISSSDLDSFLRLALTGEILLIRKIAGNWVQHGKNTSSNLPFRDIYPNIRIFSESVRKAVEGGLGDKKDFEGPLKQYQTTVLIHLFQCTIGKTSTNPLSFLSLLRLAFRINPWLLVNRRFWGAAIVFIRPLFHEGLWRFRHRLSQSRPGRLIKRILGRKQTQV